jgi:penicillin-binding protein 2
MVQSIDEQPLAPPAVHAVEVPDTYWDEIIGGMEEVVHGERGTAKVMGRTLTYRMAGKTGTAQVVGYAQGIKYDASQVAKRRRDHALFVGFAPVDNPRIAIAVLVENGEHGASTAAPIARKVIDTYLGVDQATPPPAPADDGDGSLE